MNNCIEGKQKMPKNMLILRPRRDRLASALFLERKDKQASQKSRKFVWKKFHFFLLQALCIESKNMENMESFCCPLSLMFYVIFRASGAKF